MKIGEEGSVCFNQSRISFSKAGDGKPIVFLHNGGSDREVWNCQFKYFSGSFQVWAFDFIGYGNSDRPNLPYTLDDQVDQLEFFLNHHGIEKPVLVGNCVGAATAIEFGRRFPDRVDKLVLANVCGGPSFFPRFEWLFRWPRIMRALTWIYAKFLYSPKILWGTPPPEADPLLKHFREVIVSSPLFVQSRLNMTMGSPTFAKFGRPLSMPSGFPKNILFWGEKNKIMPRRYAELCLGYLKSEEFHSMPQAGHMCMHEAGDFANRKIEEFLLK